MPIAIVVHGGAGGTITAERVEAVQVGCREATLAGWRILQEGGSALDAVEAAVCVLEDNPNFNAGRGACLTSRGTIELDAGIMEGRTLDVGAVACVELIKNPISLARKVLESPHVLLVCEGAQRFAEEQGIPFCNYDDLFTERQYNIWKARQAQAQEAGTQGQGASSIQANEEEHGTVGAVALDSAGVLAAATSTGGITNKYPGRVGDSPLVGCGFYACEEAAVSCTGLGENFIRLLIARQAADYVTHGASAREAAERAIALLSAKTGGTGGLIIVDRLGHTGFAWNTENMPYGYMLESLPEPTTGV